MLYRLITFIWILVIGCKIPAQNSQTPAKEIIEIFADVSGNDTLQKVIYLLENQLNKSDKNLRFKLSPVSQFKGSGIILENISKSKFNGNLQGSESFSINVNGKQIKLIGNSNLSLRHAVFEWLEHLGYRFYFPHPDWHIIPKKLALYTVINKTYSPAFNHRRIFYEYGTGSQQADNDFTFWEFANKMGSSLGAVYGHAYDDIVGRNRTIFLNHPEWFYPKATQGQLPIDPKFDISNESLIQFIIDDVLQRIESSIRNKAPIKMVSLSPSDSRGFCNSQACQKIGTVSDRVFYLVNRVAKVIRIKYPGVYVGCLAYDEYAEPPNIKLEPNIYVAITTAFSSSKYSTEELVNKWRAKGVQIGIYDYFSQFSFDYDIPGQSQASSKDRLVNSIRNYYEKGVRGYEGQSSTGWINKGLGFYLSAKTMWNTQIPEQTIREEFFKSCFGNASSIIKSLWESWEQNGFSSLRDSDLAYWVDLVKEAEKVESNSQVQNRFFQIKTYLQYLFLLKKYNNEKSATNLLSLLSYGNRTLNLSSVIGYPAFFELGNRSGMNGFSFGPNALWKNDTQSVSMKEIDLMIEENRRHLKVLPSVTAFKYSDKFSTLSKLNLNSFLFSDSTQINNKFWLTNEWVFQIKKEGTPNYIDIIGDYIGDKTVTKPIRFLIYKYKSDGKFDFKEPLIVYDYSSKMTKERIALNKLSEGYYTMIVEDPVKIYQITFSSSVNYSVVMRANRHIQTTSLNYAFIYVPDGISNFNVSKGKILNMVTPTGRRIELSDNGLNDVSVSILPGESGLWRIKYLADKLFIDGIPPYIGLSPTQMLIPIIEK